MHTEILPLAGATPGLAHSLKVLRFGQPGRGPKAYIQAALHADEVPALLVAQALRETLLALEAAGQVLGEVVLVPFANPLGLAQHQFGRHEGRFDMRDGVNFNRMVPDLSDAAAAAVQGKLGDDEASNAALLRAALREAAAALKSSNPAQDLKNHLIRLAIDADIAYDLHCDADAVMHLYGLTPQAKECAELGALLGARAVLLVTETGDSPFVEACTRPWLVARQRYPRHPLPLGCFGATIELRGVTDTSLALAQQDAHAMLEHLRRRGVLASAPLPLPAPLCQPTTLAASEAVVTPHAGVVVFHQPPGAQLAAGAHIADVVNPDTGEVQALHCQSAGVMYTRAGARWALAGQSVARVAGTALARN